MYFQKFKSRLKQYLHVSLHFALVEAVEHKKIEEKHRFFFVLAFVCLFNKFSADFLFLINLCHFLILLVCYYPCL